MTNNSAIEERTEFLRAVRFTKDQQEEIERTEHWISENDYTPAQYIVWLESELKGRYNLGD